MKKFLKSFSKILICVMVLGIFSKVSAESTPEAVQAFRETVEKTSKIDSRVSRADFYFVVPTLQTELEVLSIADDKVFKAKGDFSFWFTDDSGTTANDEIPFYITQADKDMVVYYQPEKKWYKLRLPSLAAALTDMIATPNPNEVEEMMSDVKEVAILQESDTRRTMLVRLDGEKIADFIKAEAEKKPVENEIETNKAMQDAATRYIDSGLRNADMWYVWTIDKTNWQTTAMSFNFSNLSQSIARAALMDETQTWGEFEKNILETVAFYSEFKGFVTYLNDEAAKKLEVPKQALKAKEVKSFTPEEK